MFKFSPSPTPTSSETSPLLNNSASTSDSLSRPFDFTKPQSEEGNERTILWPEEFATDSLECLKRFLFTATWTWNEASKKTQQMPRLPHIEAFAEEWFYTRQYGIPLVVEKSRRLVISWTARACRLWSMGLTQEDNIVAGLTYEKSAKHVWRCWHIYDECRKRFPSWNLPPAQPYGSLPARKLDSIVFANGSKIEQCNEETKSIQGDGYTGVDIEELSLMKLPEDVYSQGMLVTEGPPGEIGGHFVSITNASTNLDWQSIKYDGKRDGSFREKPYVGGMVRRSLGKTQEGRYLKIHYSADPKKTAAWAAKARKRMDARTWRVQMEMDEQVFGGEPVFPDFVPAVHIIEEASNHTLSEPPIFPGSAFFGGWDMGMTLNPAFVLGQVTEDGQILGMMEFLPDHPMPMSSFAPLVRMELERRYQNRIRIWHFGDETGRTKSGTDGRSAFQVAADHGFRITAVSNNWDNRKNAVGWSLLDWITDVIPRTMIPESTMPVLARGFRGAYKLRVSPSGDQTGPGAVYGSPLKNQYSHVQDAWQYLVIKAQEFISVTHVRAREDPARLEMSHQERLRKWMKRAA